MHPIKNDTGVIVSSCGGFQIMTFDMKNVKKVVSFSATVKLSSNPDAVVIEQSVSYN